MKLFQKSEQYVRGRNLRALGTYICALTNQAHCIIEEGYMHGSEGQVANLEHLKLIQHDIKGHR